MARRHRAVDEQRLRRAADAGAAHLGVERDGARHGEIGGAVDIDVADAFEMRHHRDPALALDPLDQRAPAARHDDVDMLGHAEHQPDRRAIAGRHELDRGFRQSGGAKPSAQAGSDGARGMELSDPPRRMAALPD